MAAYDVIENLVTRNLNPGWKFYGTSGPLGEVIGIDNDDIKENVGFFIENDFEDVYDEVADFYKWGIALINISRSPRYNS